MFRLLLKKEILGHLLTFRFAAALATTVTLVLVSMWVLGDDYLRRRDAYNLAAEETARQDREIYVPCQCGQDRQRDSPPGIRQLFILRSRRLLAETVCFQLSPEGSEPMDYIKAIAGA